MNKRQRIDMIAVRANKKQLIKTIVVKLRSIFMLVGIPIFFTFFFGAVFSKVFVEEIPIGILNEDNSSISRNIVQQFEEGPDFRVTYYAQSDAELNEAIKTKKVQAGLIIPKNFSKDVTEMKSPKTILLIDETNIVIGNNALSYGSAILNTLNAKVQLNVLEKNNMLPYVAQKSVNALSFTERVVYDPQISYMKYLLYGIIAILVQQSYLGVIVPILMEEKLKMADMKMLSKEGLIKIITIFIRILMLVVLVYIGATSSLYYAGKYFYLPLRGNLLICYIMLGIFIINLTAIALIISAFFDKITQSVQFCMFLSVPTLLTAGYSWPEYMMPPGFANIVKMVWPLIYFANPLRIINLKGADLSVMLPYIKGGLSYAAFWMPIGIGLYVIKLIAVKVITRKLLPPKEAN